MFDNRNQRDRAQDTMTMIPSGPGPRRVTPMPVDYLVTNPFQPRLTIDPVDLQPLVDSIQRYGFMGHIEARRNPVDHALPLQIVFGHRRVEAAKLAGLPTVPVAITERSDEQMRRITFVENAARKALSYWEEALFLETMKRELGLSVRQIAEALSLSRTYVQERLDLLKLPQGPLREAAERADIGFSVAWFLTQMPDQEREELFSQVRHGELNVTDLRMIRRAHVQRQRQLEQEHAAGSTPHEPPTIPTSLPVMDPLSRRQTSLATTSERPATHSAPSQPLFGTTATPALVPIQAPRHPQASASPPRFASPSPSERISPLDEVAEPADEVSAARQVESAALPEATPRGVFFDRTLIPRHSGLDYAIEVIKQLEANTFHLCQKLAKADFSTLDDELSGRLVQAKSGLHDALAQIP